MSVVTADEKKSAKELENDPNSEPISNAEDPPSYEESVCDSSWDANLTWPNTLANRDELAQLFRLNNYDYATRGRAFTVSGPAEVAPRYRNIINYFENSLEDMSSIEWSANSGLQRSVPHLQGSRFSCKDVGNLSPALRNGPRKMNGAHSTSKDPIPWEYIKESAQNTTSRFTVKLVHETDEDPPNYSITEPYRESGKPARPISTSGSCLINTNDTRHCSISRDSPLNNTHISKQPSAPSLDQINQPEPMYRPDSWYGGPPMGRIVTAPAILEKSPVAEPRSTAEEEQKTVSFYLGESGSSGLEKAEEAQGYVPSDFSSYSAKKESRSSETGDSGYGDESYPTVNISDVTPLKISEIVQRPDHTAIHIDKTSSRSNLVPQQHQPDQWENHRLFRLEEPKKDTSCKVWAAVLFFICDLALIVTGALLLIFNYSANTVTGFVLLGVGIAICIPALNYIGGLPTVCAGIES